MVTLTNGERRGGMFRSVDSTRLALTDRAGTPFSIPLSDIARIVARGQGDGIANGAAIGAGVGLGAALGILAGVGAQDGYVLPSVKVGAPLLLTGAGALIGALIDRAHRGDRVVYVALSRGP